MKVLFLYPLWTGETKGISRYFAKTSGGTYIPYNLALLAAITEKAGHEAKIIDGELEKISLEEMVNRLIIVQLIKLLANGLIKERINRRRKKRKMKKRKKKRKI